ncbi:predicted protein [Naegleria gruberi]|uniref:Predicted protein n=1 Tax=Naegleria gruberi TaxID=5762 RepID=D2VRD4_NAEGR|nr:uncharacterized protein NAEGRDRAFT_51652 [Naegleria gruberi]EFC40650.1 predicted protein [Naegleria gruberi]|eukprot:XP_002673394.1 predicted protein [Naegleria gruberi strain NEG-M]
MRHTKVGNVGTTIISSMKQLKSLGLCRTEINHGDIRNICALTDLQSLDIGLSNMNKDLLSFVCSKLRNLTSLDLGSTWIGDSEVKVICEKLPKLTSLNLGCNGSITHDSLVQLAKLSQLSCLSLRGCSQIGSDPELDLQVICLMKSLTTLDLDGTIFKEDHIEKIKLALAPKLKTLIYEVLVYEKDEDDIRYC